MLRKSPTASHRVFSRAIAMSFETVFVSLLAVVALVGAQVPKAEEVARAENGKIITRKTSNTFATSLNRGYATPFSASLLAGTEQCQPNEMSCEDDKLTVCGLGNVKFTIPCSSLFGGKPGFCDCDKIQCSLTRPLCAREEENKCSAAGEKLPDPKDCHIFTYCDGTNRVTIKCPTGFTYNPANKSCDPKQICHSLKCSGKVLEWIPFPQAPNYYLFCMYGQGEVRRCEQEGYVMQSNKCQFRCGKPGLFKDSNAENCKKGIWYSCSYSRNSTLVKQTNYCGKDGDAQLYFDEDVGICTKKDSCSSSPGQDSNNNNNNNNGSNNPPK